MASFKKAGQCNFIKKGQVWRSEQNGRLGVIVRKGKRGKEWIVNFHKASHHMNEGTILKFFKKV